MRLGSLLGAAVGAAAAVAFVRRRNAERREHVDLYYGDGSMLSLERDSPDASGLLDRALAVLDAAAPR